MFARLFAESGLSLDRLRALLEVGAAGSIVKAAEGDPVRQSQFSRQIKELEDFFQVKLLERHGKGIRLTPNGKELARISRFFLLGLSNFQRGCQAEEQIFRIGASATFVERWLMPVLSEPAMVHRCPRFVVEVAADDEIERRLHDLTLDFGVVTASALSRPLQRNELSAWRLRLWVPKDLFRTKHLASQAFRAGRLPLVVAVRELPLSAIPFLHAGEPAITCASFLEARVALLRRGVAAVLPEFLKLEGQGMEFHSIKLAAAAPELCYSLAWNPRMLRLNPHATRQRDSLAQSFASRHR